MDYEGRRSTPTVAVCLVLVLSAFAAPAKAQVSGTVRDLGTMSPIAGAIVTIQATDMEVVTGADGTYDLPTAIGTDLVVVGANVGYFYGAATVTSPATGVDLVLEAVPVEDDPSEPFAQGCSRCHEEQSSELFDSPMTHAGTNTWVYDIYDGTGTEYGDEGFVYIRDSPHAADNPESECASCHQPEHWARSPGAALSDISDLSFEAERGVSCAVCHAIASVDDARPNYPGLHPDSVVLSRTTTPGLVVMYGVLGDVDYHEPGEMRAAYQPQLTAAVCGTCHQDKNDPDGDGDFEEDDGVISEPTYLEWLASDYADPASSSYATCVDCHSTATDEPRACSISEVTVMRPPGEVRHHDFRGTTAEYLDNAVTMTMTAAVNGDSFEVSVTIDNDQTGHSVPTGVTIRNMILIVEAWRAEDDLVLTHTGTETIHDLGGVGDPAEGYFAGLPGRLYGKINHDADGNGPVFFTDATGIESDNRILALESDTTDYTFDVPADGGELHVRARLIYRRSWRALVDAKQWTLDGHDNPLEDVQAPHFGHLMEEGEEVVTLPYEPLSDAGADAGADASVDSGPPVEADDGCGCATPGGSSGSGAWGVALLFAVLFARRRR